MDIHIIYEIQEKGYFSDYDHFYLDDLGEKIENILFMEVEYTYFDFAEYNNFGLT